MPVDAFFTAVVVPLTFARRAIGWLASPRQQAALRRDGRPHGCRDSALPCFWIRRAGEGAAQRCAAEESHFDVFCEAVKAEEPSALILDAIEGRVPFHSLAHAGDGAHDEGVEVASDVAFPARHGRDVGLHGAVAVSLRDLTIAA